MLNTHELVAVVPALLSIVTPSVVVTVKFVVLQPLLIDPDPFFDPSGKLVKVDKPIAPSSTLSKIPSLSSSKSSTSFTPSLSVSRQALTEAFIALL